MAGRVRLAITGIQDQWLTGQPQYSHFLMNYKRHSRFSIEAVESPFDGKSSLGNTLECRIPITKGDLIRSMILKIRIKGLGSSSKLYNTSIGSRIIDTVDLLIGGQPVERLTGDYIYMYDQLHSNKDDTDQTLYFLNGHGGHINFPSDTDLYINLPFYFFRHPSLAIPVCSITKQLVEVRIKYKSPDYKIAYDFDKGVSPPIISPISSGDILKSSLITDFFYITEEEKNYMKSKPLEYVITQLQKSSITFKPGELKKSFMIQFKHPVKELLFNAVVEERNTVVRNGKECIPVVVEDDPTLHVSPSFNVRSDHRFIKNISLECNGEELFSHGRKYLSYEQSLRHHTGCPSPAHEFYTYSFAMYPEEYYPSGHINMSRIMHKKMTIELDETDALNDITVNIYALNHNILHVESGLAGLKF